ncbi:hypothetical protein AD42_0553 [Escherichia coli 3-073-06_S4_C3]|nr:hypothetical protein AD42_0553 [Escherichia coli 3-073-06_S4_C3]
MSVSSFMGCLKGKKLRADWEFEIQIQEQGVLLQRILR